LVVVRPVVMCHYFAMDIELSQKFENFIRGKTKIEDFESWVYTNEQLENQLSPEVYTELISLNFHEPSARLEVTKLVKDEIDYGRLHTASLIALLDKLIQREGEVVDLLYQVYDFMNLGYNFLGRLNIFGNFGEQGKSVVLLIDETMDEQTKWDKIVYHEPDLVRELIILRDKISTGRIFLTGESYSNKYLGEQFEFVEKEADNIRSCCTTPPKSKQDR